MSLSTGKYECNHARFDDGIDEYFFSSEEEVGLSDAKLLRGKQFLFIIDFTSSHDLVEMRLDVKAQEKGAYPDFTMFNSFPVNAYFGASQFASIKVEQFAETDNYAKMADDKKDCVSDTGDQKAQKTTECILNQTAESVFRKVGCVPGYVSKSIHNVSAPCNWKQRLTYPVSILHHLHNGLYDCKRPCNEIRYQLKIDRLGNIYKRMQTDKIIGQKEIEKTGLYTYLFANKTGHELLSLVQFQNNTEDIIKHRISKLSAMKIQFGGADYQKVVRDVRATAMDKLSLIGGTLGLFTGFSIISIYEFVFWIYKSNLRLLSKHTQ